MNISSHLYYKLFYEITRKVLEHNLSIRCILTKKSIYYLAPIITILCHVTDISIYFSVLCVSERSPKK